MNKTNRRFLAEKASGFPTNLSTRKRNACVLIGFIFLVVQTYRLAYFKSKHFSHWLNDSWGAEPARANLVGFSEWSLVGYVIFMAPAGNTHKNASVVCMDGQNIETFFF